MVETDSAPKFRPIFKVVPMFILWKIWKKRNNVKLGGRMSLYSIRLEISRNLVYMPKFIYPWLINIPTSCPDFVKFLEEHYPIIGGEVGFCKLPIWDFTSVIQIVHQKGTLALVQELVA